MTPPEGVSAFALADVGATGLTHPGIGRRKRSKAHRRLQFYILMAAIEWLAIVASFEAASLARPEFGAILPGEPLLLVLATLHVSLTFQLGGYGLRMLRSWTAGLRMALSGLFMATLLVFGIGFAWELSVDVSRGFLVSGILAAAIAVVASRRFMHWLATRSFPDGPIEVIVIADDPSAAALLGYRTIDARQLRPACDLDNPESLDRLGRTIWRADRVLLACRPADREAWVLALKGSGIDVELLLPEFEALGILSVDRHRGRIAACVSKGQLALRDRMVKRGFDLIVVIWLLPLMLLALLVVSIAIKLDDGGPVFFAQRRIGQGNRFFDLFKFRTMRVDRLDGAGQRSTARGDPRLTRVGGFLRQLLNVLLGSMSIVGPRPHATGSTAEDQLFWAVDRRYWLRHAAKPGLTGLAQIRGFRGATYTRGAIVHRIQADLEYVAGWSLWRDMRILAATVGVLVHPNAY
jgi:polysaccharide biosynthesis protein PslA